MMSLHLVRETRCLDETFPHNLSSKASWRPVTTHGFLLDDYTAGFQRSKFLGSTYNLIVCLSKVDVNSSYAQVFPQKFKGVLEENIIYINKSNHYDYHQNSI